VGTGNLKEGLASRKVNHVIKKAVVTIMAISRENNILSWLLLVVNERSASFVL
jgi:hypothetical protein